MAGKRSARLVPDVASRCARLARFETPGSADTLGETMRLRSVAASVPMRLLLACGLACLVAGPGALLAADGPRVLVPDCKIVNQGCGLDSASPDLDPHACAATLVNLLDQRHVQGSAVGPGAASCSDPNVLMLQASLTALCPTGTGLLGLEAARRTDYQVVLRLQDCAGGGTVGTGSATRGMQGGRRRALSDALEEMGHHLLEGRIRRSHRGTAIGWYGPDPSGWRSAELLAGWIDVSGGGVNDFLKASNLGNADKAPRATLLVGYVPRTMRNARFGIGLDLLRMRQSGDGLFDPANFNQNPVTNPAGPAHIDLDLRATGVDFDALYGWAFTRNQRIGIRGTVGYYMMGWALAPANIDVEGSPEGTGEMSGHAWGRSAEARYDWNVTAHIDLSLAAGYEKLDFGRANIVDEKRFFPFSVDYSGPAFQAGIAARF
jgi:hypothetical protein